MEEINKLASAGKRGFVTFNGTWQAANKINVKDVTLVAFIYSEQNFVCLVKLISDYLA